MNVNWKNLANRVFLIATLIVLFVIVPALVWVMVTVLTDSVILGIIAAALVAWLIDRILVGVTPEVGAKA